MDTLRSCIVSLSMADIDFFFVDCSFIYFAYQRNSFSSLLFQILIQITICVLRLNFFSPFNILVIRSFSFAVCQNQILQITEACGVLIRYILNKFEKSSNSDTKILLHALKSLCEGKSQDQDFDQIVFSSILRNAKYPEHKSNVTGWSQIGIMFY